MTKLLKHVLKLILKNKSFKPNKAHKSKTHSNDIYKCIQRPENKDSSKAKCEVCLKPQKGSKRKNNKLIFWETCKAWVHQKWYGRYLFRKVPITSWYCQRCSFNAFKEHQTAKDISKAKCFLCHDFKGILIRVKYKSKKHWAHHLWVELIHEIEFTDLRSCDEIEGKVRDKRNRLRCETGWGKTGYCIQCNYKDCVTAYHIPWALQLGLLQDRSFKNIKNINNFKPFFCQKHKEVGKKTLSAKGISGINPKLFEHKVHKNIIQSPVISNKRVMPKSLDKNIEVKNQSSVKNTKSKNSLLISGITREGSRKKKREIKSDRKDADIEFSISRRLSK